MPVLPALLPAAACSRAAGGPAGHLEGSVSPAEGERWWQRHTGIQAATGSSLPSHCGTGKVLIPNLVNFSVSFPLS